MNRFKIKIKGFGKIKYALIIIFAITVVGVSGYMILEDFSFIDSLYMTVITVATVGFREVHELSDTGKLFTIFLIISSWSTFAYAISVITSHFVEGELANIFKAYRNKSEVRKMKKHVIVIGYGRNGRQACEELEAHKQAFLIVEREHELIINNSSNILKFIEGDATIDETLINAGVANAKALITTLPLDADNLFVVLTARSLNPDLIIVSRAARDTSGNKLRIAGVNSVVMPEKVGGEHMASLVLRPDVVEFLDHISVQGVDQTNLEEIVCSEFSKNLMNHTIQDLDVRMKSGVNIIGFKTPEGKFIINPTPDTLMIPNSKLFVLGTPEQISTFKRMVKQGGV